MSMIGMHLRNYMFVFHAIMIEKVLYNGTANIFTKRSGKYNSCWEKLFELT